METSEKKSNGKINDKWLANFKKLCAKYEIDDQKIDFVSLDWELTYPELKRIVLEMITAYSTKAMEIKAKSVTEDDIRHKENELKADYERDIKLKQSEEIKNVHSTALHVFDNLRQYADMVMKGHTNNLILFGPTSCGKTWQVLSVANENNLVLGKDYEHLGGFTTPLELFQSLYTHNGKILIFDDISGITNDIKSISILKEAMWGNPKRWVHYSTTSDKLEVPAVFEFTGRIILIANKIENENDLNTKALLSRAISYTLELNKEQIMDVMIDIAKNGNFNLSIQHRLEVIKYIGSIADETTKELNLRSLIKSFDIFAYCLKEKKDYKLMLNELFKPDEELVLIKKLISQYVKRSDAVKEYCAITGKSHMSFYRNLKKITI